MVTSFACLCQSILRPHHLNYKYNKYTHKISIIKLLTGNIHFICQYFWKLQNILGIFKHSKTTSSNRHLIRKWLLIKHRKTKSPTLTPKQNFFFFWNTVLHNEHFIRKSFYSLLIQISTPVCNIYKFSSLKK